MRLTDRTLRIWAWALFILFMAAGWGSALLLIANPESGSDWGGDGVFATLGFGLMVTLFPLVGALLIQSQPRNRIGWVLVAIGASWALTSVGDMYAAWALELHPGSLPGGEAVVALNSGLWLPPILLMGVYLILLFPDGHLPSPRWRILAWGALVVGVCGFASITLYPGPIDDVAIPVEQNPLGVEALQPLFDVLFYIVLPLIPLCVLAAAVSAVLRYRRATGVARLQMKWLMAAGAVVAVFFATTMTMSLSNLFRTPDGSDNAVQVFFQTLSITAFGLIPIAIGIAVTRHKLYDIDVLISRALVIGTLGVFVTALYVGIVVGVGASIGQRQPSVWLSVLATALVAVLFQPVRERVHRFANRLVYGSRATPYEVLSDFSVSMAGRYTTAELLPRMAQTVSECLGGARVEVWLRTGQEMARDVVWPAEQPGDETAVRSVPMAGEAVPALSADRVVPVRHGEELLGLLVVTKPPTEPVTPVEDAMLGYVASQAGLVLRNVRLVDDLRSSRERLVTTQADERRRLERNLHDGAQQSLVSVALLLRMAAGYDDPARLSAALTEASTQLQQAIAELRELARGIHPAILTDRGLGPALTSLAERCPVPVHLDNQVHRRLPPRVEGTLYFVVAEALTNVARYSQAPEVYVVVADENNSVELEVIDHGVGGADQSSGSGLLGLADRVAVVDGTFVVDSPPGRGTTISCRVPVPAAVVPEQTVREAIVEPVS
ncbi:MAG TPA: histidine kinase [Microlunatus sp.]|nr:histidine kinase [Microlunatus sp.]